ncbi:hypothetical protein C8R43DRAFT_1136602 [Mycena crocata]|nr:hypothetical protein C8R43DRAFT_1136602 [Mycena crocata]
MASGDMIGAILLTIVFILLVQLSRLSLRSALHGQYVQDSHGSVPLLYYNRLSNHAKTARLGAFPFRAFPPELTAHILESFNPTLAIFSSRRRVLGACREN